MTKLSDTLVSAICQRGVITISATERLSTVEDIMTLGHVRHMPVVLAGRLVGVVSERDLLIASLSNLSHHRSEERRAFLHVVEIESVMSSPPIVVPPDASVAEAARIMAEKKIGCLPVVKEHHLEGMITETDGLRFVATTESAR